MKLSTPESILVQTAAVQMARLSGPHGYRFDGDTAHLNSMFALLHPAAHDCSWALQLWACPSAPASAQELAGHIVAEVPLPPMGELADEIEHFEVSALACPPAGGGEYNMVLVLAAGRAGQYQDVHDLAVYPQLQAFAQPQLRGSVGYRIDGGRARISVESVENPRPSDNRSGTLSLELWALPAPFAGGRFQGHKLAGVEIGTLEGQCELNLQPMDLSFNQPPAGEWQIVLMLREWTVGGFVTRDFANFAIRFVVEPAVEEAPAPVAVKIATPVVEKPAAPLIETAAAPVVVKSETPVAEKPAAPVVPVAPVAVAAPAPQKVDAPVVAKAPVAEPVKAPVPAPAAVLATLPPAAKPSPVAPSKTAAPVSAKLVSVNHARVEELTAVEGINKKIAENILKKRPFASLDGLGEVKGMSAMILAKIRASLKL